MGTIEVGKVFNAAWDFNKACRHVCGVGSCRVVNVCCVARNVINIISVTAIQRVKTCPTGESIVSRSAVNGVIATATVNRVISIAASKVIVACSTVDTVTANSSVERVIAALAKYDLVSGKRCKGNKIISIAAVHRIVAAFVQIVDLVIASTTVNQIVTSTTRQGVIACATV